MTTAAAAAALDFHPPLLPQPSRRLSHPGDLGGDTAQFATLATSKVAGRTEIPFSQIRNHGLTDYRIQRCGVVEGGTHFYKRRGRNAL